MKPSDTDTTKERINIKCEEKVQSAKVKREKHAAGIIQNNQASG